MMTEIPTVSFASRRMKFYPCGHSWSTRLCGVKFISLAEPHLATQKQTWPWVFRFKTTAELQTAASESELMSSIDCATSSSISEHCVPKPSGSCCCPRIWSLFIGTLNFIKGNWSSILDQQSLSKAPWDLLSVALKRLFYLKSPTLTKRHPLL